MLTTLWHRLRCTIRDGRAQLLRAESLEASIQHLVAEGVLTADHAVTLRAQLTQQLAQSHYVLNHLGAHVGIGIIFAFDVVPLPLGTIGRVAWVAGSRVVETVRRHRHRARVHSLGVFLLAAIPWFGYTAYLLPLRRQSPALVFLLANHMWLQRTGQTYEQFVLTARSPLRRVARWLVPVPDIPDSDSRAECESVTMES